MARSPSRWNTPLIMVPRVAPAPILPLNPDQLLSTTRAVRKRLDFDRPVSDDVIRECVALAMQSPSGSNAMTMQFVVVRDPAKKQAIGEVYKACFGMYRTWDGVYIGSIDKGSEEMNAQQARSAQSADYLGERMGEAPALVIACSTGGRVDGQPAIISANRFGNILPAMWSFMLAARARGLGTCWTTLHLIMEQQIADILGIPFDDVTQAVLTPLAYTVGTEFRPATRPDPDTIIHWDQW